VIRTEVDVTLGDPGASVAELRTMGEVVRDAGVRADLLVDALLVLARSEGQGRSGLDQREPVDLAGLVPGAVAAVAAEASARALSVTSHAVPARVEGDPQLLERLVGNLVENAVRHNVDGGWVTVETGTSDAGAWLSVTNTGPVLPAGEVEGLFQPFRRGGTARTGTRGAGLGLSIVRAVATAHGGAVTAAARDGGGLEVTVRLPLAARTPVPV
jgi:signal transduction histidine kinase